MLRNVGRRLSRPYGPHGDRLGRDPKSLMPLRSEMTTVRASSAAHFNGNIRKRFQSGQWRSNLHAIPRDVGELPRDYLLRVVYANEPITIARLFAIVKEMPDCPVDSQAHMRQVVRVARLQSWVYAEKNQTDNKWYFYIHPNRRTAVQEFLRQDREQEKEAVATEKETEKVRVSEALAAKSQRLDATIRSLQRELARNVSRIREFDAEFCDTLPFCSENGAIRYDWYRQSQ